MEKTWPEFFEKACYTIFINCFEKGKIVTRDYYATLLENLNNKIKPHMANKVLFHQDNALTHNNKISVLNTETNSK